MDGKPGTNWKQVTPENRKKVGPLVRHYMKQAHPFTACVNDNTKRFGEDRAKRICAVVKDMGKRTTKWRKGGSGKVQEAPAEVDYDALVAEAWDDVIAPTLEAEGVTVEELADWSEMAVAAGVLEAVTFEPDELVEAARVAEAGAVMARGHRRPGESLTDFGKRMKGADRQAQAAADAKKKTRSGDSASSDFEKKHPRGRGGKWKVSVGGQAVEVSAGADGNLRATSSSDAIRRFQRQHGLTVDGVIGRQTAAALLGNKGASKVRVGRMSDEQRRKLRGGRVREAVGGDPLEALAGVTFRPSELVEALRRT